MRTHPEIGLFVTSCCKMSKDLRVFGCVSHLSCASNFFSLSIMVFPLSKVTFLVDVVKSRFPYNYTLVGRAASLSVSLDRLHYGQNLSPQH